jgi:phage terminase small subunit
MGVNEESQVSRDAEGLTIEELEKLLKPKQIRFVQEYEKDGNGTMAAIRAGYGKKDKDGKINERAVAVTASRMLRNANILAYRCAYTRDLYKQANISKESITLKLLKIYEQSIAGQPHMSFDPVTGTYKPDGFWMFNDRGAYKSMELVGKSIGMFEEKLTVKSAGSVEEYLRKLEAQQAEGEQAGGEF